MLVPRFGSQTCDAPAVLANNKNKIAYLFVLTRSVDCLWYSSICCFISQSFDCYKRVVSEKMKLHIACAICAICSNICPIFTKQHGISNFISVS